MLSLPNSHVVDAVVADTLKLAEKGGKEETFKTCETIFSALGKRTFYMGGSGSGASAKLIVNLVLGLNRMVLAEGLSLAEKTGMDPHRALQRRHHFLLRGPRGKNETVNTREFR